MFQAISSLFFASKECHKLFKVRMYHETCPEQNLELVAAGVLRQDLLLFITYFPTFFVLFEF